MGRAASTIAGPLDWLFWVVTGLSLFFTTVVAIGLIYFAVKYRRRREDEVPVQIEGAIRLEMTWIIIPLILSMIVFAWSAILYVRMSTPPSDAMQMYVVGRQWMWKAQHPTGQWENNELHVPVGRPITLTMTSQDVIHDFFIPEFRVKQDVLPNRYTQMHFTPSKAGEYKIFCAEYCGTQHSGMIGRVIAMSETDYQTWLTGGLAGESPAMAGLRLFNNLGCNNCHRSDSLQQAPNLNGVYGQPVRLANGQTVTADDAYIRESIINPQAKLVAGFNPIMPTFAGQVTEEQLLQLIAYIRSLSNQPGGAGGQDTGDRGQEAPDSAGGSGQQNLDETTGGQGGDSTGDRGQEAPDSAGGSGQQNLDETTGGGDNGGTTQPTAPANQAP